MPPWLILTIAGASLVLLLQDTAMANPNAASYWEKLYRLPHGILDKIATVESRNNPMASRNVGGDARRGGAWGLLQVTAATAQDELPKILDAYPNNKNVIANLKLFSAKGNKSLFIPAVNYMIAGHYLKRQLWRFDGNIYAAVGAYNRGGQGMARFLSSGNNAQELQYVKKVFA